MGRVVTYLDRAKESLEKERVAEVAKIQEELSGKLLAEQSGRKKAEQRLEVLETGLVEVRVEEFQAALDNVARLDEAEILEKERRKKLEEKVKMLEKSLKAQWSAKKPRNTLLKDK